MAYLPEDIRTAIITRIEAVSTTQSSFYRAPSPALDATWPAFILEYADNENVWAGSKSNKYTFAFNLYIAYIFDPADEASIELAEKAISDSIGHLQEVVFVDPGCLDLPSGWVYISDTSWGYGGTESAPLRMASMQVQVTVHKDR